MSSHYAIGGMDGRDSAISTDRPQAGSLKTDDQSKKVVDATETKGPKWPLTRIAKYYAVSLAVATVLTSVGLLIAKFAFHQDLDLTGKTFWIAAGSSLGGAIVLPLLIGGGITLHKAYKKEKSKQNVIKQFDQACAGLDSLAAEETEKAARAKLEAQMDDPNNIVDTSSKAAKKAKSSN